MASPLACLTIVAMCVISTEAWYVPGNPVAEYCNWTSTKEHDKKDSDCQSKLPVSVNRLESTMKYVPYDYTRFDFCNLPSDSYVKENLGQVLGGDRMHKAPLNIYFLKEEHCSVACQKTIKPKSLKWRYLKEAIDLVYKHYWFVDDLPVVWCYDPYDGEYCVPGFPIGCHITADGKPMDMCIISPEFLKANTYYLFNHLEFEIFYEKKSDSTSDKLRGSIVKVKVTPHSISYPDKATINSDTQLPRIPLAISSNFTEDVTVTYTYSVKFQVEEDMSALHRWNFILNSGHLSQIFQLSTMNSGLVIAFLSGGLAILSYKIKASRNKQEDSMGWQSIREDVFYTPTAHLPLAVLVGSGLQVIVTVLVVLGLASLGTISAANPGSIITTMLIGYVFLGSFPAGYVTIMLYKMWGGEYWKTATTITAVGLPAMVLFQLFMSNMFLLSQHSAAVLPVTTWMALLAVWAFINTPVVFLGSYAAHRQKRTLHPVPPTEIRMVVPKKTCGQKVGCAIMKFLCLVLPFGCIFLQVYCVMNALWNNLIFNSYGFLALAFALLMVTCIEVSVLLCYVELNSQDYKWAWKSFIFSGSGSVLLFAYNIYYYLTRVVAHDPISSAIYYGVTTVMVLAFFLFTGALGFLSCLYFVRKLYMPYAKDYYQKPLNVLVERELKNVGATEELLESINHDDEDEDDEVSTEVRPLLTGSSRDENA